MALLEKPHPNSYSIVQARNRFATLIHHAEAVHQPIHVTRRGETVAVILSIEAYEHLAATPQTVAIDVAYQQWRESFAVDTWQDDDPFADVRDDTPLSADPTWT